MSGGVLTLPLFYLSREERRFLLLYSVIAIALSMMFLRLIRAAVVVVAYLKRLFSKYIV